MGARVAVLVIERRQFQRYWDHLDQMISFAAVVGGGDCQKMCRKGKCVAAARDGVLVARGGSVVVI